VVLLNLAKVQTAATIAIHAIHATPAQPAAIHVMTTAHAARTLHYRNGACGSRAAFHSNAVGVMRL